MQILGTILTYALLILFGVLPGVFMTVSIPAVLLWKVYRKVRFGYKMTD